MTGSPWVVITGASRGIGRATALAFAQAGRPVALISRGAAELNDLVSEITQLGGQALALPLDLSQVAQVRPAVAALVAQIGGVDILVNNAGMGYTAGLADTPLADWQRVLDLNLTAALQCIQAVLPTMRAAHCGTIINVVSIAGRQTFPDWGAYCVSKFGLLALSQTLAAEERPHGIRVCGFCPGAVNTPLWDTPTVQADFNRAAMLTPEIVAQTLVHVALLPEAAAVEELVLMPRGGAF